MSDPSKTEQHSSELLNLIHIYSESHVLEHLERLKRNGDLKYINPSYFHRVEEEWIFSGISMSHFGTQRSLLGEAINRNMTRLIPMLYDICNSSKVTLGIGVDVGVDVGISESSSVSVEDGNTKPIYIQ